MLPLHRHDTQITPAAAGHDANARSIPVWDLVVRIFHWSVVAGVLANYVFLEAGKAPHRYVGYAVAGALAVRVVWGFVGSTHARFADFVTTPRAAAMHIASAATGRDRRYVGHNPAGGLMMLALMALLAAVCITGWMQGLDRFWGEQWLQDHACVARRRRAGHGGAARDGGGSGEPPTSREPRACDGDRAQTGSI